MDLYDVFDRLEQTPLGEAVRNSYWLFPAIEAVHLLALAMLGGAILIVDLRLLGVGLTAQRTPIVHRYAQPWLLLAIGTLIATGIPLLLSEAIKLYYSDAYWLKMWSLLAALLFTFLVRNRVARQDLPHPLLAKLVAAASLSIWFTVAAAGRWIGFSERRDTNRASAVAAASVAGVG